MAPGWTVVDGLTEPERRDVDSLLRAIADRADDEALTEAARERLEAGAPVRHGLRRAPDGLLTGYAVLHDDHGTLDAEPALGTYDQALADLLATRGGPVALLLRGGDADASAALVRQGWRERRALWLLRRPLPADPVPPTDLVVRPFEPGRDEAVWVAQNNAAFAGHPTQSHMTVELVVRREHAAWFDAKGFLLFFDGERLVASCWTKVHHRLAGDVGEIYVVSVAPSAQGRGLGRLAVLAGLDHLHGRGVDEAELFVEESNVAARALYEALGFSAAARVVELAFEPDQPAPTARPTP